MLQRAIANRRDDPAFQANLAYGYVGLQSLPEALTRDPAQEKPGP